MLGIIEDLQVALSVMILQHALVKQDSFWHRCVYHFQGTITSLGCPIYSIGLMIDDLWKHVRRNLHLIIWCLELYRKFSVATIDFQLLEVSS